ncbi:acyl carrier protein [Vibrio spartinae]|nr:acyl carrier protein [Vibrio spartinae]
MMLTNQLIQHIAQQFLDGDTDGLERDTPLFELNIVDSAAIFDLVDFLKNEAQVEIKMQDIYPENFASVAAMVSLVERLKGNQTEGEQV